MFKLIHFWKNTLVLISVTSFKCQNLQNPNKISDKFAKVSSTIYIYLYIAPIIDSRYDLIEQTASIFLSSFAFCSVQQIQLVRRLEVGQAWQRLANFSHAKSNAAFVLTRRQAEQCSAASVPRKSRPRQEVAWSCGMATTRFRFFQLFEEGKKQNEKQ